MRSQVYSIDTGILYETTASTFFADGGPTNMSTHGGDLFHSSGDGTYEMLGERRVAFWMEARWDTDNDDWIGCAPEIEGEGC
jgi:hypothetical protein